MGVMFVSALHLKMNFVQQVPRLLKQKLGVRFECYNTNKIYAEGAWSRQTRLKSLKSYKLFFSSRKASIGAVLMGIPVPVP
jgi:hypothetical protein